MADGPTEPEPDDGGRPEEGPILSPEELDIEESEHVEQLDEGRFVVSPDARSEEGSSSSGESRSEPVPEPEGQSESDSQPEPATGELTMEDAHAWLRESFEGPGSRYGFDVTATFGESVTQRRMASNDLVTIFESLILWYAQQVDSDTPVEEILGILLMEANVPIRYPPESLKELVKSSGLEPDDTIADLVAAVDEEDGVKL
ncbi:MAG: hypothetical protein ACI8XM_001433 [Haloarculaceae archaeon]|jgi:hypothetical protein